MAERPAWLEDPDGASLWEGTAGRRAATAAEGTVPETTGEEAPGSEATLDLDWLGQGGPRFAPVGLPARYLWRELLGAGGMGEVHRVHDTVLGREVALKVVQGARWSPGARDAFREEARLTAALQHPAIVPVHELGELPDGRLFYTMPVVPGESLAARIAAAHRDGPPAPPTRRSLADLVLRSAEAVAHAHARGIVHRDLKPANIMVGGPGEVRVLDWGLGTRGGNRLGVVSGTPSWMAPEQAHGEAVGPATDVWALGAVLAATLLARSPFPARDLASARARLSGALQPPPCPFTDEESTALWSIVERCLQPEPHRRLGDAGALAQALADWRDGVQQRQRAMEAVRRADGLGAQAAEHRSAAAAHQAELDAQPEASHSADPAVLARVWAREDARDARLLDAARLESEQVSALHDALRAAPDLEAARQRLADHAQRCHAAAEDAGDATGAARWAAELRRWDRGRHAAWLDGTARLTLRTDPPGAEVWAARRVERGRRLEEGPARCLGQTPLSAVPLAPGEWVLTLRAPGRLVVRHPVHLRRCEHLGSPGDPAAAPLPLPRAGALGPGEVYLPPGWAVIGGEDPLVDRPVPRQRLFFPALVAQVHPLRHRDLMDWWLAERAAGRGDRARALLPRTGELTEQPAYELDEDGDVVIVPDADGDVWDPDWPAFLLRWADAWGIAESMAARDGLPWRLPGELEWERMARGPAGSVYPWGTAQLSPAWCHMRTSPGGLLPARVGDHPLDTSVFGVCGLAGNVVEWCAEDYPTTTPITADGTVRHLPRDEPGAGRIKTARGGSFGYTRGSCRSTVRRALSAGSRYANIGMRLVRDLVPGDR